MAHRLLKMKLRPLSIISILVWCLAVSASTGNGGGTTVKEESEARWQKIIAIKNSSQTELQVEECTAQMEWFKSHDQWDKYYRTWQLKANSLCALGKLQLALQETQLMLNDAKERGNRLGHAMAYKQIGIIYLNMKQTEPAIEALQHYAELMKDEEGDIGSLSNIYYRMAKAYDYDKSYNQELQVTDEWMKFLNAKAAKTSNTHFEEYYNSCYLARAAAYIGKQKLDSAIMALDTASVYAHKRNTALSLHHFYKMQARYYLACGNAAKALGFTDSVRKVTNEKDDHNDEIRAEALVMLGQNAEAASIYKRLYQEKDSVFSRDARQHLDELNTLFQVDELKTEQQRTKILYVFLASLSVVLALLVLLLYGWRSAIKERKTNEELRIANERATVSSKMKTEFIRNISHEIRTPLNILSGFTQILTAPDMELPQEEKKDMQERIAENTDRITKLVDRMLELSDASSEAIIECNDQLDAHTLAVQAIEHSRITTHTLPDNPSAKVKFEYIDKNDGLVILNTNKKYAVRTLSHLLENATKFTKDGSITLYTKLTDSALQFIVEDTGIGIPKGQAEYIFGEFVQLDSFAEGTGIGLTVARSIARRMGGDLWIDTDYTNGARFVFEMRRDINNNENEKI